MYWIRDKEGSLVNLALADQVRAGPSDGDLMGTWQLRAYFSTGEIILLVGTRNECGMFLESLYARLKERQECEYYY